MPREHRRIFFAADELLNAMVAHDRTLPARVMLGEAEACVTGAGPSVAVKCRVQDGNVYRSQQAELPLEFVLHSMIRYCLENNIMIPRPGRKTVEYCDGEICLQITLGTGQPGA